MADDLSKLASALKSQFEGLAAQHGQADAAISKASAAIRKLPEPKLVFRGLMDAYMTLIKKSDGLTSARPATLKAIQTAEKSPSVDTVRQAVSEMKRHIAELEKTSKKEKAFALFDKNMEALIKKTEALIG